MLQAEERQSHTIEVTHEDASDPMLQGICMWLRTVCTAPAQAGMVQLSAVIISDVGYCQFASPGNVHDLSLIMPLLVVSGQTLMPGIANHSSGFQSNNEK